MRIGIVYNIIVLCILSYNVHAQKVKAVDLGLPSGIKWANMNVGASSPEEYGTYYAWGEVRSKRYYGDYSNNKHLDNTSIHKYNYLPLENSIPDYLLLLQSEDDAATVNLGTKWRMPTDEEMQELIDNCEFVKDTLNGTRGYIVRNKTGEGSSIFLPFAGSIEYGRHRLFPGTKACYWSSTLENLKTVRVVQEKVMRVLAGELHKDSVNTNDVRSAKCFILSDGDPIIEKRERTIGCVIRPVYASKK